jgi:hypothetical protein
MLQYEPEIRDFIENSSLSRNQVDAKKYALAMYRGWGLALGATATLLGSALVHWVRGHFTKKRRAPSQVRGKQGQAIQAYLEALTGVVQFGHTSGWEGQ